MVSDSESLRRELRQAGITARAIDAMWPEWWSSDAESSLSARTELRYTVARRLGLSPRSLFDGPPRFVWKEEAKFKNLGTESQRDLAILTAFGAAVARCATEAAEDHEIPSGLSAQALRSSLLKSASFVSLLELLTFCWGVGIPVLQQRLFPLSQKRMHAMTARFGQRYAVLIGRESKFLSQIAYAVAHEIGHIVLQHVADYAALVELDDPLQVAQRDHEEEAADRFALEVLTGEQTPEVVADRQQFTAGELAHAAIEASWDRRIEPGALALCLGHSTGKWRQTFGALKIIPPGETDVGGLINAVADSQLNWASLSLENQDYLKKVMGGAGGP